MLFENGKPMKKANHRTDRNSITDLQQIINIGPATAEDLLRIGIKQPQQLSGKDPLKLYQKVCQQQRQRVDPCVLDVMMAAVDYMNGNPPKVWWKYTSARKQKYTV
jgi:hypothetical protein